MQRPDRQRRWLAVLLIVMSGAIAMQADAFTGVTKITGRVAIGEIRYNLTGTIERSSDSPTYVLDLALDLAEKHVREIQVAVTPDGGTLRIGTTTQTIPAVTAKRWFEQLESDFQNLTDEQRFAKRPGPEGLVFLDAIEPIMICFGVEGRMRLRYINRLSIEQRNNGLCSQCRLVGVEFFSLGEWTNAFGEYVAFTMNFEAGER